MSEVLPYDGPELTAPTPVLDQTPPNCHCGQRLVMVTDEFGPITDFRGIWCLDCLVQANDDCDPDLAPAGMTETRN